MIGFVCRALCTTTVTVLERGPRLNMCLLCSALCERGLTSLQAQRPRPSYGTCCTQQPLTPRPDCVLVNNLPLRVTVSVPPRSGQVRSGQVRSGQVRSGQHRQPDPPTRGLFSSSPAASLLELRTQRLIFFFLKKKKGKKECPASTEL